MGWLGPPLSPLQFVRRRFVRKWTWRRTWDTFITPSGRHVRGVRQRLKSCRTTWDIFYRYEGLVGSIGSQCTPLGWHGRGRGSGCEGAHEIRSLCRLVGDVKLLSKSWRITWDIFYRYDGFVWPIGLLCMSLGWQGRGRGIRREGSPEIRSLCHQDVLYEVWDYFQRAEEPHGTSTPGMIGILDGLVRSLSPSPPICEKVRGRGLDMKAHMRYVHYAVRTSCARCETTFKELKNHMRHLLQV